MAKSTTSKPRKTVAEAQATEASKIKTFLADFAKDLPHEAQCGDYSFTQRDRFHGNKPGIRDGWHLGSGWALHIVGGAPFEAVHEDHPRYRDIARKARKQAA